MIFDENYDKVLWLLVAGNKKDSDNICKLISYIPEGVYVQIQNAIASYYNDTLVDMRDNVIFSTTLSDIEGFDYYIYVKIKMGKLYFNVRRWCENDYRIEEDYELILKDIDMDDIRDMLYYDKYCFGKYSHEFNNIHFDGYLNNVETINYDRKYYLKRIPFGYMVSSKLSKRIFARKYVNVVKNMPEQIFVDDFSSQERIGCLIKKRKKMGVNRKGKI